MDIMSKPSWQEIFHKAITEAKRKHIDNQCRPRFLMDPSDCSGSISIADMKVILNEFSKNFKRT